MLNWREVASVCCDCRASALGNQAVNIIGQNSGPTARDLSHGKVTAIDQAPDHMRGNIQSPRNFSLRNPVMTTLEHHEHHKRTALPPSIAFAMFWGIVTNTRILQPRPSLCEPDRLCQVNEKPREGDPGGFNGRSRTVRGQQPYTPRRFLTLGGAPEPSFLAGQVLLDDLDQPGLS